MRDDDGTVGRCVAAALDDGGAPLADAGVDGGTRDDAGPIDPGDVDGGPRDDGGTGDAGPPPMAANDITVGGGFACARTYGDEAYCWGYNSNGQLGIADTTVNKIHPPSRVTGLSDVRAIAAGENHACALARAFGEDGIWCWGDSANGALGTEPGQELGLPHRVEVDDAVHESAVDLQTGVSSTCVRTSDGDVWCWGPLVPDYTAGNPVRIDALSGAIRLHVSDGAICAKLSTGGVRCLDQPGAVRSLCDSGTLSLPCPDLLTAETFRFTASNACRVDAGDSVGALHCGGSNEFGVVYPTSPSSNQWEFTPLEEWIDYSIKQVTLGDQHACALGHDSIVRCWGRNLRYSTGQPDDVGEPCSNQSTCHEPLVVPGLPDITDLDTFRSLTCGVADDGALWCWGLLGGETGFAPERYVIPD